MNKKDTFSYYIILLFVLFMFFMYGLVINDAIIASKERIDDINYECSCEYCTSNDTK